MRAADLIAKIIEREVKSVFMVNGRGALFVDDALLANKNIQTICTHGEAAAGFCAIGYAKMHGFGVCVVSSGVAGSNLFTPLLCAYQDHIPLLFISGQNTSTQTSYLWSLKHSSKLLFRTFGEQEANLCSLAAPLCKYSAMVDNANDLQKHLNLAISAAKTPPFGPCWLDIPLDIQNARIKINIDENFQTQFYENYLEKIKNDVEIKKYCDEIVDINNGLKRVIKGFAKAKKPLLLLGSGASKEAKLINEFVKNIKNLRVAWESGGVDILEIKNYPFKCGVIGLLGGSEMANSVLLESDFILALGCKFRASSYGLDFREKFLGEIYFAGDLGELQKGVIFAKCGIYGDLSEFLENLNKEKIILNENVNFLESKQIDTNCEEIDLYDLADILNETLSEEAVVCLDSGLCDLILTKRIDFSYKRLCIQSEAQGCMGFALSAALGAGVSCEDSSKKRSIVAILGDGSFMFNLQELQSLVYFGYPIKIIICNNNGYGTISSRQKWLFRREIGNDEKSGISFPSFEQISNTFGLKFSKFENLAKLKNGIKEFLQEPNIALCELITNKNQKYFHKRSLFENR